jgi:hypothetical protein
VVSTAYTPYRENQLSAPPRLCLPTTILTGTGPRACAIPNEMAAAKAPLTRLNNPPSNAAEGKPLAKSSMKDGSNARIACKAISVAEINGVHAL